MTLDEEFEIIKEFVDKDEGLFKKPPKNAKYKNGEMEGKFIKYWKNGNLWLKYSMKNGQEDGPSEKYYENGQLAQKCNVRENSIAPGHVEEYWDNGQLKEKYYLKKDWSKKNSERYNKDGTPFDIYKK